jgi:hypothetical protein
VGDIIAGTSPFEGKLVRLFNEYFEQTNLHGFAFRLKQGRFSTQFIDVLVDSRSPGYYLAVEAKSIDPRKTAKYYFSSWQRVSGRNQVETISEFVNKTQRFGIMAAEIRQGRGPIPNDIFLIPWSHVEYAFETGKKAINPTDLPGKYPQLKKDVDGLLNLEKCLSDLRQF